MLSKKTRQRMIEDGFDPNCEKYSPEYQRWVRSNCSSRQCAINGAKGFAALVVAGKGDLAATIASDYRFNKPSDLERIVIKWLDELGLPADRKHREVKIGRFYADFRYGDYIIEVGSDTWHTNNQFHGEDREGRDKRKYQYLSDQGYTIIILSEQSVRSNQARETLESLVEQLSNQV